WVGAALYIAWRIFGKGSLRTSSLLRNAFHINRVYSLATNVFVAANDQTTTFTERRIIDRSLHAAVYFQAIVAHVIGWVDRFVIDGTVNGAARLTGWFGKATRSIQGGNVQLYIFWAIFAIIIFIIWALN